MNCNSNSGESTTGAVGGAVEVERGQGDAKDKPSLKMDEVIVPISAGGIGAEGPLKELELPMKMSACSLETTREELLANRRAAWKEEIKKELEKRAEFKREMEFFTMDEVMKCEDKQTMSKMSMSAKWREGFKEKRTSFLFNEVFPLQLKTPGNYTLSASDVLSCREVSKAWKETVDDCVSTSLKLALSELARYNQEGPFGQNPFFTRKVLLGSSIEPTKWRDNLFYWGQMDKLLQRWGKEIWMAEIYLPTGMGMETMYETLVKYLNLMPNLRSLQIVDQDRELLVQVQMLRLKKDVFGPLKELMARKPLPELPNLRNIRLSQFLPDPMISAILTKYRGSLETVHLERPDLEQGKIPVGMDNDNDDVPIMKQFLLSSLMSHSTFDFPLLEDLSLEGYKAEGVEDVVSLFKTFNSWGSTLRRLHLGMTFRICIKELMSRDYPDHFLTGPVRLELPLLERITIHVSYTDLRNIDFLLELKSLKELDLRYDMLAPNHEIIKRIGTVFTTPPKEDAIQFRGYEHRLGESNIWELFPNLRLVSIKAKRVFPQLMRGMIVNMWKDYEEAVTYTRDGGKSEKVTKLSKLDVAKDIVANRQRKLAQNSICS